MASAADTLFLPIMNGDVGLGSGSWLFLGARVPEKGFSPEIFEQLTCEQALRGPFLDLQMRGLNVHGAIPDGDQYSGALVLIGKHRGENEAMIERAKRTTRNGAKIVVAGDKTSGIVSLKKRVAQGSSIEGSQAKYHATVFWFSNDAVDSGQEQVADSSKSADFFTAPGMFSPGKIDKGSALLAEFIDGSIRGAVADFGAGWGYLSHVIAQKGAPSLLDLFESHWPSLEAAKRNLRQFDGLPIIYHWHDIVREPIAKKFDCIVMNPPFHQGRKTEPALGEAFIEAAANALKPKGRLLLVANSGLPYENKLSARFSLLKQLEKRDGFKVLLANK